MPTNTITRLTRLEALLPPVPGIRGGVDPSVLTPEEMEQAAAIRRKLDAGGSLSAPDLALADRLRAKLAGAVGASSSTG